MKSTNSSYSNYKENKYTPLEEANISENEQQQNFFINDLKGDPHEINKGFFKMSNEVKDLTKIVSPDSKRKRFNSVEEHQKFVEDYKKKYKTEICKNFEFKGTCHWGDQCSFAHGHTELRNKTHINLHYKSKLCKQFFEKGHCNYGYRCQYLHNDRCYSQLLTSNVEKLHLWIQTNSNLTMDKILTKTKSYCRRLKIFDKFYRINVRL